MILIPYQLKLSTLGIKAIIHNRLNMYRSESEQIYPEQECDYLLSSCSQIFYFERSPNNFEGFDDESQIKLNKYIESILNDK
jgi:hypothetical protein